MNKSFLKLAGALALGLGLSSFAFAGQITGTVAFNGTVTLGLNGVADTDLGTANEALSYVHATAGFGTQTGSFVGLTGGETVSLANPWFFNDSTLITNFWQVGNFSFDLASSSIVTQNGTFLNVTGVGTLYDATDGFSPTSGIWSFTIPQAGVGTANFTFAASTTAVPDGSTTVMLLGLGLLGLKVASSRRRKVA